MPDIDLEEEDMAARSQPVLPPKKEEGSSRSQPSADAQERSPQAPASSAAEALDVLNPANMAMRFVGGRSQRLPAVKNAARSGFLKGRRKVTLWKAEDGDSFLIGLRTGKAETRLRLSVEAMDALVGLYDAMSGDKSRQVYRFIVDWAAAKSSKAKWSEAAPKASPLGAEPKAEHREEPK